MSKTLITGATGFIGSAVVRELLDAGHEVRALIRKTSDTRNIDGLDLERVYGDIRDEESVQAALKGCDTLFHTAALYTTWLPESKTIYEINVEGTKNVLRAALEAGVEKVVYTSTAGVIGKNADGSLPNEETPFNLWDVSGHYIRSKYMAEQEALRICREEGLPAVIVNPTLPIGPRDVRPTPNGQMILDFLSRRLPGYVEGGFNLVAVEDVAKGHLLAAERGRIGERYILGYRNMTLKEMFELLEKLTGIPAPRLRLPYSLTLAGAYTLEGIARLTGKPPLINVDSIRTSHLTLHYDCSKAVRELGMPQTSVEEAIRRAVEWFRKNGYVKKEADERR